jgi:hypothetical protein
MIMRVHLQANAKNRMLYLPASPFKGASFQDTKRMRGRRTSPTRQPALNEYHEGNRRVKQKGLIQATSNLKKPPEKRSSAIPGPLGGE